MVLKTIILNISLRFICLTGLEQLQFVVIWSITNFSLKS